jgi:hypothetical protein
MKPDYLDTDHCLFTALALRDYGGSFASALGEAFLRADLGNRRRLIEAFPDIMETYGPSSDWYRNAKNTYYGVA